MRYEVEPDGTLRILEDDKPAPEPRKPSGPREPRGTGVSFMAVAHHVCHALVVLAIVLGIVAGLLSPLGLWGTISNAASRGWASLLYHLSKLDILYGPRWLLQRGIVVIPKSVHKERMEENMNVFDFQLDETDMEVIRSLDTKKSTIYDEMDPQISLFIGSRKIHD